MDLTPYVAHLRRELAVAAEAGGHDARALAERLTAPLDSAVRLTLLDALSTAAEEITRELAPGSVDVRLRGRDADFVVTPPPVDHLDDEPDEAPPPPGAPAPPEDDSATARINLRLPDHLKTRVEQAAAAERLSVNSWLVRAVAAALDPPRATPRAPRHHGANRMRGDWNWGGPGGQRYTGWVR